MSGGSNVQHFLATHGLPATPEVVRAVLDEAKRSERVLTEAEILDVVQGPTRPA